jgi:chromosomal replication initiation ATPase DnaA
MINQVEILDFFREVQRVISKHGLQKVLSQLRKIQNDFDNTTEKAIFDFVLIETAKHYNIEINDILNSKKRGVISEARRMSFALMKEHLPFTDEEIGYYFGSRSRQYVNKELTSLPINQDNLWKKRDVKFVNDFMVLTTSVLNFKNEYNLNNKIVE